MNVANTKFVEESEEDRECLNKELVGKWRETKNST